jgi:Trypsin
VRWFVCPSLILAGVILSSGPILAQIEVPSIRPGFITAPLPTTGPAAIQAQGTLRLRDALDTFIQNARGLTPQARQSLSSLPTGVLVERLATRQVPPPLQNISPFMASTQGGGGPVAAHPGVALLLVRQSGGDKSVPWCTGTLVSPNEIITAAHCVCPPDDGYSDATTCKNGVGPHPASPYLEVDRWSAFFQHAGLRRIVQITVDDAYSFPSSGRNIMGDLAILQLDHSIPWITPAPLARTRTNESFSQALGVGFGWSAQLAASSTLASKFVAAGMKTQGIMNRIVCGPTVETDTIGAHICSTFSSADVASAGICPGDSGGPLWYAGASEQVGVASGADYDPCNRSEVAKTITEVEERLSFGANHDWLQQHLSSEVVPTTGTLWPAFGTNLRNVLDPHNATVFETNGRFTGGWATSPTGILLVTANSVLPIHEFQVQRDDGTVVCEGRVTASTGIETVNWCFASVATAGRRYRLVAAGESPLPPGFESQQLQYVIAILPAGTNAE